MSAAIQAFWSPWVEMVKEHSLIYLGLVFAYQGLQFWWWFFPSAQQFLGDRSRFISHCASACFPFM